MPATVLLLFAGVSGLCKIYCVNLQATVPQHMTLAKLSGKMRLLYFLVRARGVSAININKVASELGTTFKKCDWIFKMVQNTSGKDAINPLPATLIGDVSHREVRVAKVKHFFQGIGTVYRVLPSFYAVNAGSGLRQTEGRCPFTATEVEDRAVLLFFFP